MPRPITERRAQRIREVLARRQPDLTLVMDNIWDPHNVSAVLRSCDAFGVDEVQLHYTTSAFPDIGAKSSASAKKWVRRRRHSDSSAMVEELHGRGFNVLATGFTPESRPLPDWDLVRPTAVVLGNEHDGVKEDILKLADGVLYVPMVGMVQSLNVSVAAALVLYEAWRQRSRAGLYDQPRLSAEELERRFAEWSGK
ncbi:TrmH family RNA methyltransferase [Desulfohalovibrio reitneri]|uniref:TrmH family RNA methyltransferase n=1 Tax=Desulfohalovibrio reitneri TaxID=1307759 RepID=UPI0004A7399C|nr:TrmH family RNA methyltransferase [Desulfohalovibrio reitneri]